MDALRPASAKAERSLKASTYRQAQATANLTTVNKSLKAAVAEVKAATESSALEDAQKKEAAIRLTRKVAQKALADANEELETRQAEADAAKQAHTGHFVARTRRVNPNDRCEEATAPVQSAEMASGSTALRPLTIAAFHGECKTSFADTSAMTSFPCPPTAPCPKLNCIRSKNERALAACACNIRDAFTGKTAKEMKQAKNVFNPDRFATAPESVRADFQAKAKEIYSVVDNMVQNAAVRGKNNGEKIHQQANRKGGKYQP